MTSAIRLAASQDNQLVTAVFGFGVAALLATTVIHYFLSFRDGKGDFPKLPGIQFYHAWNFFRNRQDFIHSNLERNSGQSFSFDVGHHKVIALTGEEARRKFYSDPRMDLSAGFRILSGKAPMTRNLRNVEARTSQSSGDITRFKKTLNKLLNPDRVQNVLPTLFQDIRAKADKWGDGGRIDPFVEIFDLVFYMTARMATCHEMTKNDADFKKLTGLVWTFMTGATPTALIIPWFPSLGRMKILWAEMKIYLILRNYVEARRQAEPTIDATDILIAEGETTRDIVQYLSIVLFAGISNTGITSCWTLIDLAVHPEWREKCKREIRDLLSRHLGDSASFATISDKLSAIPPSAWEDELPVLDACTRESQRLFFTNIMLRRNVRDDFDIGGKVVKRGDFLTYSAREVHLSPEYYPEPHKYDPGRWLRPDPTPKTIYPFLAWGAGRHPCAGMRLAKAEMKWMVVMFLMRYEYELVNADGQFPDPLPVPSTGDRKRRPLGATCYFRFKKVME